jgi:hypothetical protein
VELPAPAARDQALENDDRAAADKEQDIFSERYLLKRPLLEAITCAKRRSC